MTPAVFVSRMTDDDKQRMIDHSVNLWNVDNQEILFDVYEKYLDGWKISRDCGKCRASAMVLIDRILKQLKNEH